MSRRNTHSTPTQKQTSWRIPVPIVSDEEMEEQNNGLHKRLTICRTCREIWAEHKDRDTRRKLKYVVSLAKAIVARVESLEGRNWIHNIYVKRHEFEEVMNEAETGHRGSDDPLCNSQ